MVNLLSTSYCTKHAADYIYYLPLTMLTMQLLVFIILISLC